jgi:hypothetical protein
MMHRRFFTVGALGLLMAGSVFVVSGSAKSKDKDKLPVYILTAHTVTVMIDPSAGMDPTDPRANEIARKDVETALVKWGRYTPVIGVQGADIIVVIRKGHQHLVDETISNPGQNNRPGMATPTDNGNTTSVGGQQGRINPNIGNNNPYAGMSQAQAQVPHPQMEIGPEADSFRVLEGNTERPFDGVPGWKYLSQDALRSPSVPAVEEFRKAVAAAEKAAAAAKKP